MAARSNPETDREIEERTLVLSRTFDAPRALVFKVWTQPEHLARWWGPRNYIVMSYKADVRPGGTFRFGVRSPENTEHWAHGTYREVTPPERLVRLCRACLDPDPAKRPQNGREILRMLLEENEQMPWLNSTSDSAQSGIIAPVESNELTEHYGNYAMSMGY